MLRYCGQAGYVLFYMLPVLLLPFEADDKGNKASSMYGFGACHAARWFCRSHEPLRVQGSCICFYSHSSSSALLSPLCDACHRPSNRPRAPPCTTDTDNARTTRGNGAGETRASTKWLSCLVLLAAAPAVSVSVCVWALALYIAYLRRTAALPLSRSGDRALLVCCFPFCSRIISPCTKTKTP